MRFICNNPTGAESKDKKKDEDKSATFWNDVVFEEPQTFTYTGPEGCMLFSMNTVTGPISKAMGFIQIVCGLFLAFYGRKFLHISLTVIAFLAATGMTFAMAFNLNLIPGLSEGKSGGLIAALCVSCVVGGLAAWLFRKVIKEWGIILAGSVCGALIAGMLLAATPLSGTIKTGAMVVAFFVSGAIIKNVGKAFVEVAITSIIGSIMFFMGVGSFDPNFPSLTASNIKSQGEAGNPIFFAYLAGMVIMTGAGWFVQLKYTSDAYSDDYDKDDMMHPDNM